MSDNELCVDDHFSAFIAAQVADGRFDSATDVVQAGLRLLEEQQSRLQVLRAEIAKGEQSGVSTRNVLDIWEEVKQRQSGTFG